MKTAHDVAGKSTSVAIRSPATPASTVTTSLWRSDRNQVRELGVTVALPNAAGAGLAEATCGVCAQPTLHRQSEADALNAASAERGCVMVPPAPGQRGRSATPRGS